MKPTSKQIEEYKEQGYLLVPGLFTTQEAGGLRDHYMAVNASGPKPGDFGGDPGNSADPLNKYPRLLNMHSWDPTTTQTATDARVLSILQQLINDVPVVNQTMLYFAAAGLRGQGVSTRTSNGSPSSRWSACGWPWMIRIRPTGTWCSCLPRPGEACVARRAGRPQHVMDRRPGQTAPGLLKTVGIDMKAGDALFFDGKTIHGSYPNTTKDRFRRCFICHYVGVNSKPFTPPEGTHMSSLAKAAATP